MYLSPQINERVEKESGCIISAVPLKGGMRSKVYRLDTVSGKSYVAKVHSSYRDDRGFSKFENEVESLSVLASMGLSPSLLFIDRDHLTILSDYIVGQNLEEYYDRNEDVAPLEQVIITMAKVHTHCSEHPHLFYRNPNDLSEAIELYRRFSGQDQIIDIVNRYKSIIVDTLSAQKEHFILGDTFASNFVWNGSIYFIDAELCSKGPAVFDLCQIMSNLNLSSEDKKKLANLYHNIKNQQELPEAFDAATIYMDLFFIAIYSREMRNSGISHEKREVMKKRIDGFRLDLNQLISNAEFSRCLMEARP